MRDDRFAWGLIGPGKIAGRFADALQAVPGAELHALLGRDPARARAFAERWPGPDGSRPQVLGDIDTLLADPRINAVYIATPHAQHGEAIARCLAAGKPVLCEKPLVPHLAEGRRLVALARAQPCFLMEAVWTRFLPVYEILGRWLREQAIGPLRGIQSSFCFAAPFDPHTRLFDPALAGGSLLDLGIYNLTVTRWVLAQALGACPEPVAIQASGRLAPTGVDQRVNATLLFAGGLASQFICGFDSDSDKALRIFGERGVISLPRDFWQATEAVLELTGEAPQRVQAPFLRNGFEGEIAEVQRCVRAGRIESALMPHDETLATLGWMDEIRRQLGVRYPFE